jgi:hypothetical protein
MSATTMPSPLSELTEAGTICTPTAISRQLCVTAAHSTRIAVARMSAM